MGKEMISDDEAQNRNLTGNFKENSRNRVNLDENIGDLSILLS